MSNSNAITYCGFLRMDLRDPRKWNCARESLKVVGRDTESLASSLKPLSSYDKWLSTVMLDDKL
jgi:hypothetical protein